MFTIRESAFRDHNSFNMVNTIETGHRVIYRKIGDEEYRLYEPEVLTRKEFLQKLDEVGLVKRVETYVDPDSLFEVCRGSLVRNGVEHFFHIMYPQGCLYKRYATGAISNILYTKEVGEDDGIS